MHSFMWPEAPVRIHSWSVTRLSGNERNLDLAQDIRRAGWDVLYFDYRGSWGSPEPSRLPCHRRYRGSYHSHAGPGDDMAVPLDPSRIVLIGHSMELHGCTRCGGRPCHPGSSPNLRSRSRRRIPQPLPREREPAAIQRLSVAYVQEGCTLAGCTPEGSLATHSTMQRSGAS